MQLLLDLTTISFFKKLVQVILTALSVFHMFAFVVFCCWAAISHANMQLALEIQKLMKFIANIESKNMSTTLITSAGL